MHHRAKVSIRKNGMKYNTILFKDVHFSSSIGVCCSTFNNKFPQMSLPQQGDHLHDIFAAKDASGTTNIIHPEERGCGLSTKTISKIISGRSNDSNDEWNWMVALFRKTLSVISCGGVLITDRHALTAAHCVHKYKANELKVRLGEYHLKRNDETRSRDFNIVEIRMHTDFDETTYENDIAILKTHQKVLFNSYIWPICLPPTGESFEGYMATVIGWGSQFFGGPSSDILQEVSVPIWNQENCQNMFVERIGEYVLCAGAKEGGRDSCQVKINCINHSYSYFNS